MKHLAKRGISLVLILALVLSLLSVLSMAVGAATVDYVYSDGTSGYIYNWGNRGETATFLSPNAIEFYEDNNTSYTALAQLAGAADEADVPSSELFAELHDLMYDNLDLWTSYDTAYGASRYLFQYTDCQDSATTSKKISSFYSGAEVGPQWDNGVTWNREHTWPDSKGPLTEGGNDAKVRREADLMMLRPASSKENSSRGNKAYGISSGFYDPNSVSNGTYAIRGDVARIILYVYTCWGTSEYEDMCLDYMWGSNGVFESPEVLLDWMEEDPVDTWEMGRNDSVESIYGTRNVFVDYPELAFTLFDAEVPADYITPSGSAAAGQHAITAVSNNTAYGTVTVSGNYITAFPAEGYEVVGYAVESGTATLTQSNNVFVVDADTDCKIRIDFAPRAVAKLTFCQSGGTVKTINDLYAGDAVVLPDHFGTVPAGYTFLGWVTDEVSDATTLPEAYAAGKEMNPTAAMTFHALYSYVGEGEGGQWTLVTDAASLTAGDQVVIAANGYSSTAGTIKSGNKYMTKVETAFSADLTTIPTLPADTAVLTLGGQTGAWTLTNEDGKKLGDSSNNLYWDSGNTTWAITIANNNATIVNSTATGNKLQYNSSSPRFKTYSSSQKAVQLYYLDTSAGVTLYTTQVSQEAQNSVINLKSVNVDFANSLTLNFNGLKSELEQYEDVYVEFTAAGKEPVRVTAYTESNSTDGTVRWNFGFNDLTILDVNLDIYATVYGTKDGVQQIGQTKTYSLLKYCTTAIEAGNDDAELCAYLLKYAMAAEAYKNVDTAKRVETALSANQKAALEAIFENNAIESATPTQNRVLNNGQQVKFTSQNVDMFSRIAMIFKISLADYTGDTSALSFEINYYDLEQDDTVTLTYGFDDLVATDVANVYELSCSGLYAAQMEERITCEIFIEGEAQAHATYENSFENYCYSAINKVGEQETMKTLAKCIYQYGKAASERFAAQS